MTEKPRFCLINLVSFLSLAMVLSGCVIVDGVNISGPLVRKCKKVIVVHHCDRGYKCSVSRPGVKSFS